jgi:hypothetical protein
MEQEISRKVKRLGVTVVDSPHSLKEKWHVDDVVTGVGGGEPVALWAWWWCSGGGHCGADLRRKGVKRRCRGEYHILDRSGGPGKLP